MKTSNENVSVLQALFSMKNFLEKEYHRTVSEDLNKLLESIGDACEGSDAWNSWIVSIDKVLSSKLEPNFILYKD